MIPALPEKDNQNIAPVGQTPAASNPPATRVSDAYDQDVLAFVARQVDQGVSETAIIESLLPHDFNHQEAERLVREIADDRSKPATRAVGRQKRYLEEAADDSDNDFKDAYVEALREAAKKDMAFGAMWFLGGFFLTILTLAAHAGGGGVIFWGAMVWGMVQFFRGMGNFASAKSRHE